MTIWNERYNSEEFLFGKEPNRFFKETIDGLIPGIILLPERAKEGMPFMLPGQAGKFMLLMPAGSERQSPGSGRSGGSEHSF
jgi:hypothetical protein